MAFVARLCCVCLLWSALIVKVLFFPDYFGLAEAVINCLEHHLLLLVVDESVDVVEVWALEEFPIVLVKVEVLLHALDGDHESLNNILAH